MSMQSSAMPQAFQSQAAERVPNPWGRTFYWSVRRELWEQKSLWLGPLVVAGMFLIGYLVTTAHLPQKMRELAALDPMKQRELIATPYDLGSAFLMLTSILVSVFYCIDALSGERRERSILFWKSMPVSDTTAILAKASLPMLFVPLYCFAVAVAMQAIMLLFSSAVLLASGVSVSPLWTQLSIFQMWMMLLYHMVTAHAIWPAPVYAWLLLVSGWARRAALLWAVLPVLMIGALEGVLFHSKHFAQLVGGRLFGASPAMDHTGPPDFPFTPMTHITFGHFLLSPGLWLGLLVTAGFLAGAVRARRSMGPS